MYFIRYPQKLGRSVMARMFAWMLIAAAVLFTPRAAAFDPIDYRGVSAAIRLSVLGRYGGGEFADSAVEGPPAYDPIRKRLYWGRESKNRIDVIDIANPAAPVQAFTIDLGFIGRGLKGVAYNGEILAVAIGGIDKTSDGYVFLFSRDGRPEGTPIDVGVQPTTVAFTPDQRTIVVPNRGEATDDYGSDPEGSVTLIDTCNFGACSDPDVETASFRPFNALRDDLIRRGVRIYGPGAGVSQDLEPESVAISADSRRAWVTLARNNAIAEVDLVDGTILSVQGLGFKDHSLPGQGLDASDLGGRINIRRWPIRGLYQPDGLAAIDIAGASYLVTANEGDPRDFGPGNYNESALLAQLPLDPIAFPDPSLKLDDKLGRLQVSTVDGDVDADGDFDAVYAYGGRSFAVWTSGAALVYDSGGAFERIIKRAVPAPYFNVADTDNVFDGRSRSRGPEPEPLATGWVDGRPYAFIGLERIGGVMVYDLSTPSLPGFQQYINNRNFAVDPAACIGNASPPPACLDIGDLSVEGVLFIPAEQSPIFVPLLVVTHETSDSLTIYRIDRVAP
jgi:hypothetical protein